jgi:hypothetical protein
MPDAGSVKSLDYSLASRPQTPIIAARESLSTRIPGADAYATITEECHLSII